MASMTTQEAEAFVQKLESLAEAPPPALLEDESLRRRLREASRNLGLSVQWPSDSVHLIAYGALYSSMARIGGDTNVFEILSSSSQPLSNEEVSEKTGVDPILMKRFLRFYQSFGWIKEVSENSYVANNITKALTGDGTTGIKFYNTLLNPPFIALPEYFKSHGYKNPTNPVDSPWQAGFGIKQHPFVWLQSQPELTALFMNWLPHERDGLNSWLDIFPFEQEAAQCTEDDDVLFVDVGSGFGSESAKLRQKHPQLKGRVVVQDQAHVIEAWKPMAAPDIEGMVYDFFTEQPLKGAKAYYMRNIMHDHQDSQCQEILRNTMKAMGKDSLLLIDDIVLPDMGAPWRATMADMNLMCALAAKERSRKEWIVLLESVGLEVVKFWQYAVETGDSIIVAKLDRAT